MRQRIRSPARLERSGWRFAVAVAVLFVIGLANAGAAEPGAAACRPGVLDDATRLVPAELVERARQLFKFDMPDSQIQSTVVYRCMNGGTMLCATGANLPCGKANTSRNLYGVAAWCRDHAEANGVPMVVSGHDTVYRWRCRGGTPYIAAVIDRIDKRGFLNRMWKEAD